MGLTRSSLPWPTAIEQLVPNLYKDEKFNPAAKVIQKHWRGSLARNKVHIYRELELCMQQATIHALNDLNTIKEMVDKNQIKAAETKLNCLKNSLNKNSANDTSQTVTQSKNTLIKSKEHSVTPHITPTITVNNETAIGNATLFSPKNTYVEHKKQLEDKAPYERNDILTTTKTDVEATSNNNQSRLFAKKEADPYKEIYAKIYLPAKEEGLVETYRTLIEALKEAAKIKSYTKALKVICTNKDHEAALAHAQILLAYKDKVTIDVNDNTGKKGYTALHHAADKGNKALYDYLKNQGADLSIKNTEGQTAEMLLKLRLEEHVKFKTKNGC